MTTLGLSERRLEVMVALCDPVRHGGSRLAESAHAFWLGLLAEHRAGERKARRKTAGRAERAAMPKELRELWGG